MAVPLALFLDSPVGDLRVAGLDHDRVDQQHRIHGVEGPHLPHGHVLHDGVGDLGDRLTAHLGVIDLRGVRLDLTGGEALGIQRDHIARQALEAALMLGHRHRLEGARTIPRHPQINLADVCLDPLGRRTVARVRRPASGGIVALTAEMLGHLDLQTTLQDLADQPLSSPPSPVSSTPSRRARATRRSAQSLIAASPAAPVAGSADIL